MVLQIMIKKLYIKFYRQFLHEKEHEDYLSGVRKTDIQKIFYNKFLVFENRYETINSQISKRK